MVPSREAAKASRIPFCEGQKKLLVYKSVFLFVPSTMVSYIL